MLNSGLYSVGTCLELQCGFLSRAAEGAATAGACYVSVASNVLVVMSFYMYIFISCMCSANESWLAFLCC